VTTIDKLTNVELRNGISPSKSGTVSGKVLTLSAITRGAFDPAAFKESLFAAPLVSEQSVSRSSFLICRGNGNPELVGRGAFPTADMPDTAFPDTMIALRGVSGELFPAYLSALWATDFLRSQIKAAAKTTNGTYKISQGGIMSFELPLPPVSLQTAFAEQVQRLEAISRALDTAAAKAEAMAVALSAQVFGAPPTKGEKHG
jgi:type I restriction enzyme S subunit